MKKDWALVSSADVLKEGDGGVLKYIATVKDDWYHRNYTPRIVTKVQTLWLSVSIFFLLLALLKGAVTLYSHFYGFFTMIL